MEACSREVPEIALTGTHDVRCLLHRPPEGS
jgi:hypothetical protein